MSNEINHWSKAASALIKPIEKFLGKIINPPLKEMGELLVDKVRFWRFKNQINILNKAKKYLEQNKINPKKISLKTLIPLLEYGSLEESESMKNKWASLLVNAANPNYKEEIRPSFVEILKELTPTEVRLLDDLYNTSINFIKEKGNKYIAEKEKICKFLNISDEDYEILIDNLFKLNLLYSPVTLEGGVTFNSIKLSTDKRIYDKVFITPLGYSFIRACKFENIVESVKKEKD